jgi:hypothetical protein
MSRAKEDGTFGPRDDRIEYSKVLRHDLQARIS